MCVENQIKILSTRISNLERVINSGIRIRAVDNKIVAEFIQQLDKIVKDDENIKRVNLTLVAAVILLLFITAYAVYDRVDGNKSILTSTYDMDH